MTEDTRMLPDGSEFIIRNTYTESEARGVGVTIFISVISLIAVSGLVSAISISAWNTRNSTNPHLFVRTNVVTYFIPLLICALFQGSFSHLSRLDRNAHAPTRVSQPNGWKMFLSALASLCLYAYVFYRIRQRLDKPSSKYGLSEKDMEDEYQIQLIKHMMMYPLAYFILILPIAIARFTSWSGHDVAFGATIFCDSVYLLIGIVFTGLFISARRILPPQSTIPKFFISGPLPRHDAEGQVMYDDPYYNPPNMFMAPRSVPLVKASMAGDVEESKSKHSSIASSMLKPLPPPPPVYTPSPSPETKARSPPRPTIPLRNPFSSRGMVAGGIARSAPRPLLRALGTSSRTSPFSFRAAARAAAPSVTSAGSERSFPNISVKSATTSSSSSAFSMRSASDAGSFDIVWPSGGPQSARTQTTTQPHSAQDDIRSLARQIDNELARAKASWRQSSESESDSDSDLYVDADARELSHADITQHVMSASTANGDDILRYYRGSPYTASPPGSPAEKRGL
ncbi:hypothetical protein OF83DRAFT_1168646 [Amylostereum chailletii]|nr:hypothetical protein OF83DRAFT_1168646 [Amylostereum chailletii]